MSTADCRDHAENAQDPRRRGESDGPQQLADVRAGLRLGHQVHADDVGGDGPEHPQQQREHDAMEDRRVVEARRQADAGGEARRDDDNQRLAGGRAVGFDFLEDRNFKPCRADRSLRKGHR